MYIIIFKSYKVGCVYFFTLNGLLKSVYFLIEGLIKVKKKGKINVLNY